MEIHEFSTSWKVPKSEIRENLNTRKWPDLQYLNKMSALDSELSP